MTLPCPLPGVLIKLPHGGDVNLDRFFYDPKLIESIDDLQGLVDGFDVKGEVVGLEDCAGLEPFDNTRLVLARA